METSVISINKKILDISKKVEVDGDVIVPDIKPDILNIINTNGNSYIYKEDINEGRMRIDGNIDSYIIYLAENGETRSIQTTLNFTEIIDNNSIVSGMYSKTKIKLESVESKVLNERKISVKAIVKIEAEFYETTNIDISNQLDDMSNIEMLEENIDIKSIIGINTVKNSVKEDISIDSSQEAVEILKTSIKVSNIENKISYNKVLAKADANIKILFLTEDGRISAVETTIPLMSFIDIEKISENNICSTDYVIRNMLFKINSKDMHSITCQIDFEIKCEVYDIKNINLIQDMYSTKDILLFSKKEVEVQTNNENICENLQIHETVLVEDISLIYDVNIVPVLLNNSRNGNFIQYEGELNLEFFYEADNKTGLNVKKIKIPFIAKIENGSENVLLNIKSSNFSVSNEYVNCNVELELIQYSSSMKKINIIENIKKQDNNEIDDYKMIVYFVKNNDTIWSIAKKFRVSMENILSLNNLESEKKLNVGDKLFIM